MKVQIQKTYEASIYPAGNLSGAAADAARLDITGDVEITKAKVLVGGAVSGDVVFAVYKNGTLLSGAGLTIPSGARAGASAAVSLPAANGDEIVLRRTSGTIVAPVNFTLEVEDGQSAGGGKSIGGSRITPANIVNGAITNVGYGGKLFTKNAGGAAWNAGFSSAESIYVGKLLINIGYVGAYRVVGLSVADTNASYDTIDYGFFFSPDPNQVRTIQSGSFGDVLTGIAFSSILEIELTYNEKGTREIVYLIDKVILAKGEVTHNDRFVVDTSINTVAGTCGIPVLIDYE